MKKVIITIMSIMLLVCSTGCKKTNKRRNVYYSYDSSDKEVNKSLFYVNSSYEWGADPSIIYVTEGEWAGYYFIYCTSAYVSNTSINCWCSKNLTDWTCLGPAFTPDVDANWAYKGFWAPQCIYDKEYGKYYLFYSAPWGSNAEIRYDSCAVSDSPAGPFVEITNDNKGVNEPLLQFELHKGEYDSSLNSPAVGYWGIEGFIKAIGPSPFIDPETGKRYLFFVADLGTENNDNTSGAYCLEMEDWATPKYETLKRITRYGYTTIDGNETISEGGKTNEGPVCQYKDGKYYLTFLTYTYYNTKYQTRVAVADNVMGPYTKVAMDDGAQVIYTEYNFQRQAVGIRDYNTDENNFTMAAYMTFANNENYDDARKFAVDRIVWLENSEGQLVPQCNGPSVTPQPLPESISGYKNVALQAKVTSDNTRRGSDVSLLTDELIPYHNNSIRDEYKANNGTTTITFDFDDYVALRAVMVYNSKDYEEMFNQIDSITFEYRQNGKTGTTTIGPIKYNWDYYDLENGKPAIGSAAIAEFNELDVKKVTITISDPGNEDGIAIPEIVLLGKDTPTTSTASLKDEYTFINETFDYDWKNTPSKLAVDGVKDDCYKTVYRLYQANDETSDTYADLSVYRGDDGIYCYVDVHCTNLVYDVKQLKYDQVKSVVDNSFITLFFAKNNTGFVTKYTAGYKVDISNETSRYVGVRSQKAWLNGWCKGATATVIKNGTLEDLSNATGYCVETFMPYEQLGISSREEAKVMRIYFATYTVENTGVIFRDISTAVKGSSISDPSTWMRLDLND